MNLKKKKKKKKDESYSHALTIPLSIYWHTHVPHDTTTAFVILEQYQSFAMRFANLVWNY
jgi:hypothetical protein